MLLVWAVLLTPVVVWLLVQAQMLVGEVLAPPERYREIYYDYYKEGIWSGVYLGFVVLVIWGGGIYLLIRGVAENLNHGLSRAKLFLKMLINLFISPFVVAAIGLSVGGFVGVIALSLYFILPYAIFGETFFVKDAFIIPNGIEGMILTVVTHGSVFFLMAVVIHKYCLKHSTKPESE